MKKRSRSSLSRSQSYKEIGEFWDSHDLADYWDETQEAEFEVEIESEATYYALSKTLSEQIQSLARKQGISADTLVNLWVQEKLRQVEKGSDLD
jgi:hypothetical protein